VPHVGEAGDVVRAQTVGGDLDQGLGSLGQGEDLPGCQDPGVHREGCDLRTVPLPHDGLRQTGKVLEEGRGGTAENLVAVEVEAGTGRADGGGGGMCGFFTVSLPYVGALEEEYDENAISFFSCQLRKIFHLLCIGIARIELFPKRNSGIF